MNPARAAAILKLVRGEVIDSQTKLFRRLRQLGFAADQPRLSKELKALGVVKVAGPDGRERYVAPDGAPPEAAVSGAVRTIASTLIDAQGAGNVVLARVRSGYAQAAAEAIERLRWSSVLLAAPAGSAVILVVRRGAADVARRLRDLRSAR